MYRKLLNKRLESIDRSRRGKNSTHSSSGKVSYVTFAHDFSDFWGLPRKKNTNEQRHALAALVLGESEPSQVEGISFLTALCFVSCENVAH